MRGSEEDVRAYGRTLARIRRRRLWLFSVVLLYVPGMWMVHGISPKMNTMLTAFIIWVCLLVVTCMAAAVCRCPRCGNYFHVNGMTMLFLRKCLHCQLHINAGRNEAKQ